VVIDVKHVVPVTLLAQACVSFVVAAVAWLSVDELAGMSALLGGMVAVVPNAFLAARLLASNRDTRDAAMMRAAWIGEIGKVLLTALLFAVIFKVVRPLAPLAVFAGFIAAQLTVFGALLIGGNVLGKEAVMKS